MTHYYGSPMILTIEDNKENIPPGMEIKEPIVLPETRANRHNNEDNSSQDASPVPRPSPAMSQLSDTSFLSCQDSPAAVNNTSADEAEDDMEITSRKEKSLGLLCQRFLIAMNEETRNNESKEVHLETVARKMNVEKRRIYDIVNVMEALDAMQKTNKSYYQWQGLESLPKLMSDLQAEAIEEGLPERVLRVEQAMCSFTELSGRAGAKDTVGTMISSPADPSTSSGGASKMESPYLKNDQKSRVDNRDRQGRNSLAQLCRRFLMVLLSNPKNVRKVSLDVASTVLIKDPETEGFEPPSRSRCRRLYDIANVLVALGLIKKVHYLFGTKKIPLFVYCGPEPDENAQFDVYASVERLLSSQQHTPSTPTIKAQTEKIVQQIAGFGKRAFSENNLNHPTNTAKTKMPKIKVEKPPSLPAANSDVTLQYAPQNYTNPASLMMFAELAAAEKYRLDAMTHHISTSMPSIYQSASTSSSEHSLKTQPVIPKPEPHKVDLRFGAPIILPFNPPNPYLQPHPTTLPIGVEQQEQKALPMKHSMSNILGSSSKQNAFDHTTSSPFQVVKKGENRQKKVFGEIQNFH